MSLQLPSQVEKQRTLLMKELTQRGWIGISFTILLIVASLQAWLVIEIKQEKTVIEQLIEKETEPTDTPPVETEDRTQTTPHAPLIKKTEQDTGVNLSVLSNLIVTEESIRQRPYADSTGTPTIGVGRNLRDNGISITEIEAIQKDIDKGLLLRETHVRNGRVHIQTLALANRIFTKPLTTDDVQLLLVHDLKETIREARSVFTSQWQSISEARKLAIIDVVFNTGLPHFKTFKKFIADVQAGNWDAAAAEILLSAAARKNFFRYQRITLVIQTNDPKHFHIRRTP